RQRMDRKSRVRGPGIPGSHGNDGVRRLHRTMRAIGVPARTVAALAVLILVPACSTSRGRVATRSTPPAAESPASQGDATPTASSTSPGVTPSASTKPTGGNGPVKTSPAKGSTTSGPTGSTAGATAGGNGKGGGPSAAAAGSSPGTTTGPGGTSAGAT